MIKSVIFSPSGTTAKVAGILAGFLAPESITYDLTVKGAEHIDIKADDDVALFAMPAYAGRLPVLAVERLQAVHGGGRPAIVVVVYGNRDYDDALAELCDFVTSRGFNVVAAGAFIAQHCIFPKVAAGRPDAADVDKLAEFAEAIRRKIAGGGTLDLDSVKGNRPYKKPAGIPLHPSVDRSRCNGCGICAEQCPAGAIERTAPQHTDGSKCITCCRCINICPRDARHLGGLLYKIAGWKFVKDNTRRLEPEWFI